MSVKTEHRLGSQFYFCTFTCTNWINLFAITNGYDQVYKWFTIAAEKGFQTCAYVIMPNHLHFIMHTPSQHATLNTLISNGKRFIAYETVKRLNTLQRKDVLKELAEAVSPSDRKRGKLHQVFEPSFDARRIFSEHMMIQKINYIHHNPVSGKWHLTHDFVFYPHSSAAFYELGKNVHFPVVHYAKILHGKDALI